MSALIAAKVLESDEVHHQVGETYYLRLNGDGTYNEEAYDVTPDETTPQTEGETGEEQEAETATGIPVEQAPGHTGDLPTADANPVDEGAKPEGS